MNKFPIKHLLDGTRKLFVELKDGLGTESNPMKVEQYGNIVELFNERGGDDGEDFAEDETYILFEGEVDYQKIAISFDGVGSDADYYEIRYNPLEGSHLDGIGRQTVRTDEVKPDENGVIHYEFELYSKYARIQAVPKGGDGWVRRCNIIGKK